MTIDSSLSPEAFEARYAGGKDPWSFACDSYELARYRTILASLQRSNYQTIYEPGCSIGVLTQQLATIAENVVATDFAPSAIEQAKLRCAKYSNVQFFCADLKKFVPPPVDLVVFSEIGYYFSETELAALTSTICEAMPSGAEFVAAHWLGVSNDHVLHGHRVHEVLRNCINWRPERKDVHEGFRLDSWTKT